MSPWRRHNIVELLCFEGEGSHNNLLLQETELARENIKSYRYDGWVSYVYSETIHGDFNHYNSQLVRYSGFIPYT